MPQESISIDRALKSEVLKMKPRGISFSNHCKNLMAEGVFFNKNPAEKLMVDFATEKINQFLNEILIEEDFLGEKGQKISSFTIRKTEATEYLNSVRMKSPPA